MLDNMLWGLGLTVVMFGGLGVAAAVAWWAIDRVLMLWTNHMAIIRVAQHARKHGLDLRTGKPFKDDEMAH